MRGWAVFVSCALFITLLFAQAALAAEPEKFELKQDSEVRQARGKKPPTTVLKRDPNGHYTWEIKGEDTEEVIAADKRLREYLRGK